MGGNGGEGSCRLSESNIHDEPRDVSHPERWFKKTRAWCRSVRAALWLRDERTLRIRVTPHARLEPPLWGGM